MARVLGGIEEPGSVIGPYTLLERLGQGGFGVVWLAERREPMVQRVALKLIKPGMDTRAVIARFEQERQALAVMDHPNVARVLDAGATPSGRPYFAMEYVNGEPITTFCDREELTIAQRLELFILVCEAVQHAHLKGVIHRDVKPSNILVAVVNADVPGAERPADAGYHIRDLTVKVIDFGVAKALDQRLAEREAFTEQGQILGTPEYMSPEQADCGRIDVDARTDVYSLGVVLYQLLSGTLPFDPEKLRAAGYAEIQRIIRDEDPPRPSTKLGEADPETAQEIGRSRGLPTEQIARELRRELEWIPLKAMEKDRKDRYTTPIEMAEDIRRYLKREPLIAGPRSRVYRVRKFLHRRRRPLLATLAMLALGASLVGLTSWGIEQSRINDAREMARAALAAGLPSMDEAAVDSAKLALLAKLSGAVGGFRQEHPGADAPEMDALDSALRDLKNTTLRTADEEMRLARADGAPVAQSQELRSKAVGKVVRLLVLFPDDEALARQAPEYVDSPKLSVTARDENGNPIPAEVLICAVDAFGALGEANHVGRAPITNHPVAAGTYRVIVKFDAGGFREVPCMPGLYRMDVRVECVRSAREEAIPNDMIGLPAGVYRWPHFTDPKVPYTGATTPIDAFLIDRCEVTNAQYKAFLDANPKRDRPLHWPEPYDPALDNLPVVWINWEDAAAYAHWAGKRLPTYAEWLYACCGPEGRPVPWIRNAHPFARYLDWGRGNVNRKLGVPRDKFENYMMNVLPVQTVGDPSAATPEGVLNMYGNVWEWTESPSVVDVDGTPVSDPFGCVATGQSWDALDRNRLAWSFSNYERSPIAKSHQVGFRCARSVAPAAAKP